MYLSLFTDSWSRIIVWYIVSHFFNLWSWDMKSYMFYVDMGQALKDNKLFMCGERF